MTDIRFPVRLADEPPSGTTTVTRAEFEEWEIWKAKDWEVVAVNPVVDLVYIRRKQNG